MTDHPSSVPRPEPTVVFSVESGDYSDHMIHALFTDEATAQRYIDALVSAVGRYETDPWEATEIQRVGEENAARARLSIERYQLWEAVPVVEDGALYDQDHTEAVS